MRVAIEQTSRRFGAAVPLTALMLIPILGMAAFALDVGWMVLAQSDLQKACDAACLAGTQQLMGQPQYNSTTKLYSLTNGFGQYYLPGQTAWQQASIVSTLTSAAKTAAKANAAANAAGALKSLVIKDNSNADTDFEFGYTDGNGNYTAIPQPCTQCPNTLKLTMRLDASANGPLQLFFGPVLGVKTINLKTTSFACIYTGTINQPNTNSSFTASILPMTYDVNHWNNFLKTGQGPDGTTNLDANGTPQLQVYPSIKFTGNFGLLSLDQGNDGASTISGWIDNGVSAADLQQEIIAKLLPLSAHDPSKWDWKGNPGLKTSDIHALSNHVGDTYLLPLFTPYNPGTANQNYNDYQAGTGNGSHYYYNIVQFVGVVISYVDNKSVVVQPAPVCAVNPTFTTGSMSPAIAPAAGSAALVTTYSTPKLIK